MGYKLFYPASLLPHKNHKLLFSPKVLECFLKNNIRLFLTIDANQLPFQSKGTVVCLGRLERKSCDRLLRESDALLFLSEFESLGLPLIEAATARKPVITFDLPYSRELLGDSPYYIKHDIRGDNPICCALSKFLSDQPTPRQAALVRDALPISTVWNHFLNAI